MRLSMLSVASLVLLGLGCTGCDEACGRRGPGFDSPPWIRADGRTRTVAGHVVTPAGDPIEGATVQLIYPGDPHWPEEVAYVAQTDAAGAFSIAAAPSPFGMVVRHGGAARTFDPPAVGFDPNERIPAVTIRFARPRPITLAVECDAPLAPSGVSPSFGPDPIVASFYWSPGDDFFSQTYLEARDGTGARSPTGQSLVQPGRVTYLPSIPADARRFGGTAPLPPGRVVAIFSGGCGTARREIEVSDASTELSLAMPEPNASTLVIRMASSHPDTVRRPEVYFGPVRIDTHEEVRAGHAMRFERLAPGRYEIRETACEPFELPPSSDTRVTIAPGRCDVRSTPRETETEGQATPEEPLAPAR